MCDSIHSLGVCRSRVGPFLAELAVASLHKSGGVLCAFPLQTDSQSGVVSGVLRAQLAAPSLSVLPVPPAQPRHEVSADVPAALTACTRLAYSAHVIAQPDCMPSTAADQPWQSLNYHLLHASPCADVMQACLLLVLAPLRDAASLPFSLRRQ